MTTRMDNNTFDHFTDEATHGVAQEWEGHGGRDITPDELYEINDLITAYFNDKR